jgi:hypothetical protein
MVFISSLPSRRNFLDRRQSLPALLMTAGLSFSLVATLVLPTGALGVSRLDAHQTNNVQNLVTVESSTLAYSGLPEEVVVRINRRMDEPMIIELGDSALTGFAFNKAWPVPNTIVKQGSATILKYDRRGDDGPAQVALTLTPEKWGRHFIDIGVVVAQRASVRASVIQNVIPSLGLFSRNLNSTRRASIGSKRD